MVGDRMGNKNKTVKQIVNFINNPEEEGGLWLPNIQRKFVWDTEQIEVLFDSIMREYPISTLLVWKTKEKIKTRKFIDNYHSGIKLADFYIPQTEKQRLMVLDGQQRLQSLYIALKGSYERKELYIDILSGLKLNPNNVKYNFKFMESPLDKKWIKFKDLIFSDKQYDDIAEEIIISIEENLNINQKKIIRNNIAKIVKLFKTDDVISYQEIDSVNNPRIYNSNDVVEVFIRANSGGTKLEKSDLLFSLLTSNWELAEDQIDSLQEDLNSGGYNFSRDFILKTCLSLIGVGSKYEVEKFRKEENLKKIQKNWTEMSNAIREVKDFLFSKTFIRTDKALPSYLGLIPLIYFRYKFKEKWDAGISNMNNWILKVLITGAFSGSPDGLIDQCTKKINDLSDFPIEELNQLILNAGRNLNISDNLIIEAGYGGKDLYLLFNLWYGQFGFNFMPSYINNAPQIDHIFPQSKLKEIKEINPKTGRANMKYKEPERNQIANCMLLTFQENGSGGKGDIPPEKWFENKSEEYLDRHLIPKNKELWKLKNYENFISERKKLLIENFKRVINN